MSLFHDLFAPAGFPMIIVASADGRVLEANPAASEFYGFRNNDICSKTLLDLTAGKGEKVTYRVKSLLSGTASMVSLHQRLEDGTVRNAELHGSPLVYMDTESRLIMIRDVTHSHTTEMELQDALRRAESASRARSEFLANASHEFRTPVSGIIGIASLLRDSNMTEEQQHLLSLIEAATGDLERMLRDLLDISRIDVGKVLIKREKFAISDLIERVHQMHAPDAASKGLDMSTSYEGKTVFYGDQTRLVQILGNLVSNAVKYTDNGGIEIISRCESDLVVEVRDTGHGIPDSKKTDVFEMFKQMENPYTKERPGLGLGLSIVQSLINLMGGKIEVEDNTGRGSIFRVTIPKTPGIVADSDEDELPGVLVVEDDPLSRFYLSTILKKRGFNITEAPDGETALDLYAPDRYIAVLMDIGLPRKSGIEVTREIRRMEAGRTPTPIWAVTAHGFQSDKERCFDAGMDGFFLKPVDEPRLTSRLMELVRADAL